MTLRLWRDRMMARADVVLGLGYSRKFLRMFEFYFAYCEAGFANRYASGPSRRRGPSARTVLLTPLPSRAVPQLLLGYSSSGARRFTKR